MGHTSSAARPAPARSAACGLSVRGSFSPSRRNVAHPPYGKCLVRKRPTFLFTPLHQHGNRGWQLERRTLQVERTPIAVDDIDSELWRDPDYLEQLSRGATRVTLADGAPADVNLRRVKLAPPR